MKFCQQYVNLFRIFDKSRPEDALVKLVKTLEIVDTVETVETVETEDLKKSLYFLTNNLKARDASASKKV